MLRKIFRRYCREPLSNVAVLIFAAIMAVVMCHLERAKEEELRSFEETYRSVPVYFSVTDFDGSRISGSDGIDGWVVDLFYEDSTMQPNFARLATDLQLRMEIDAIKGVFKLEDEESSGRHQGRGGTPETLRLAGISSTRVAEELTQEYGGEIRWYEGYGEDILKTDSYVCLAPESWEGGDEIVLSFRYKEEQTEIERVYTCTLTVAGRYTDEGNTFLYCPYPTLELIYGKLHRGKQIQCVSATLADNNEMETLRATASYWFAEPNPMGEPTKWGKFGFDEYLYAMDINDTLLQTLVTTLENSMLVNRLSSAMIFVMSALAGFLTGFLVIRSRKREISLMRTLGNSNAGIYAEFALEQVVCLLVGVLLGGGYALWQPVGKLALFVAVNFVGLSAALVVFLHKNLLTTIKEDE